MKHAALCLALLVCVATSAEAGSKIVISRMGDSIDVRDAPNGARLRTMGGNISVRRANGMVSAKSMGGNIEIDGLAGSLEAGTMGGNVEVDVVGGGTGREIEIKSMGGHVELTLPANFAADFEVEIEQDDDGDDHYRIISDFPLRTKQSTRRRWFSGTREVITATGRTGAGGNVVRIKVMESDITIRKR